MSRLCRRLGPGGFAGLGLWDWVWREQRFSRDTQVTVKPLNHSKRERAFAIQDFRYPRPVADMRLQVLAGQAVTLHEIVDCLDRLEAE